MMNKKNLEHIIALVMALSMVAACSDDDTNPTSQIVGQWECVSANTTEYRLSTDEIINAHYGLTIFPVGTILYFYEDDTCYELKQGTPKNYYTYKINEDKLDFISNNVTYTCNYSFSSGKLNISYVYIDPDRDLKFVDTSTFRKQ